MTDDDLLERMRRDLAEDQRLYSNAGKEERERWVVGEFLTHLDEPFAVRELNSLPQYNAAQNFAAPGSYFGASRLGVHEPIACQYAPATAVRILV
jgi:hypothetical protein